MRSNQVGISVTRLLDREKLGVEDLSIRAYADSDNVYEALAAAYFEVLEQLQMEGKIELPVFGRREHYPAASFSYNKIFSDFLKSNHDYEEHWLDFKKEHSTLEDQFLKEEGLFEEFELYLNECRKNRKS